MYLDDIIKFLISKDKSGKTVLHSRSCSEVQCNCPNRLAAGSVDSLLGKLRASFYNLDRLHDSNPVAHARVKQYFKFIREEQAGKAIVPSQAVPLFFVKFSKLISFLRRSIEAGVHLSLVNKYILVMDATFFVVDFFTGDRASDLGRLLANQGCLPFVRINRLGRALNNGKGFSKISKPTERNGANHLQFDFP